MQVQIGPVIEEAHSARLTSSQDFTFNGLTLDFENLAPHGVTDKALGSAQPLTGSVFPVLTFAFGGYGIAIGETRRSR